MSLKVKLAALSLSLVWLLSANQAHSQRKLFLFGNVELTNLPLSYSFQQKGKILQRGWAWDNGTVGGGYDFSYSLALHYRTSKSFGIEAGFQQCPMFTFVYDRSYMKRIGITWVPQMEATHQVTSFPELKQTMEIL
ncbi:MAG: hypothetical protein QM734_12900 [Cyclobacteriaceae bacterium]